MAAIVGVCLLTGGFYFFRQVSGRWQESQSAFTQIIVAASPHLQPYIDTLRVWYFGSIGVMLLGAVLTIVGIVQTVPDTEYSFKKNAMRILEAIGMGVIVLASIGFFDSVLRASPLYTVSPPAVSAPAKVTQHATDRSGSHAGAPISASAREVVRGLAQLSSLEWEYFQRYGTFTGNLQSLGVTSLTDLPYGNGSQYLYRIRGATQSQVVIEATGKLRTRASGTKLTVYLNADGTPKAVRRR
jgi:hypothetical protein